MDEHINYHELLANGQHKPGYGVLFARNVSSYSLGKKTSYLSKGEFKKGFYSIVPEKLTTSQRKTWDTWVQDLISCYISVVCNILGIEPKDTGNKNNDQLYFRGFHQFSRTLLARSIKKGSFAVHSYSSEEMNNMGFLSKII